MRLLQHSRKKSFLVFTVGLGMLLWSSAPIHAEQADLTEPCKGIRETISWYIALGTPDDLISIRLREAFDLIERELARLQLDVPPEELAQFAEKQKSLKELQDRLFESGVVFGYLDRYGEETPFHGVDRLSAEERASLRDKLLGRINALQKTICTREKAIRYDQEKYRQCLVVERKDIATLLAARRAELLAEYATFLDCHAVDRPCLQKRLRVLCNLKPLVLWAERLPILRLIAEVDSRLNAGGQTESTSCESL